MVRRAVVDARFWVVYDCIIASISLKIDAAENGARRLLTQRPDHAVTL